MLRRTIRAEILAAISLLALPFAEAVEWPTSQAELKSNFGQNDRGSASVGMAFEGDDAVRASDAGEIVFAASGGSFADQADGFPYPLGDWIAVDHGNGILSVYGRMLDEDRSAEPKTLVEKGAILGRSGTSGWAESTGFYFSIYDRKVRRWVNPTMIAPERKDDKAPTIKSVALVGRDGQLIQIPQTKSVRQGSYRIIVEASDSEGGKRGGNLAPQRLMCLINGTEQGSIHLETIQAENGQLYVSRREATPVGQAYLENGAYDLGEARLARGRTTIEVIARDAVGNERIQTIGLIVE